MSAPPLPRIGEGFVQEHPAAAVEATRGVGPHAWLLAIWIFLEFAKPATQTFKIPMLIVAFLFLAWLTRTPKRWPGQLVYTLLFVAVMAIHVPFARNNFHAFWSTYYMATTLVVACALVQFADSVARVSFVINALIVALVYVGLWAVTHGGYGPLGAASGQDENYVSMAMSVGFPLAFFSIFVARSWLLKLGYAAAGGIFAMATVIGLSRGGFLGLCSVGFYCWLRSTRKRLAIVIVSLVALLVLLAAPERYWTEMETMADPNDETADLRIEFWKIAWREFLDHPVVGVGPGNYRWYAGEYQSADQHAKYDRSFAGSYVTHSLYFELISEMGLVGTLLFGAVLAANFRDTHWIGRTARVRVDTSSTRDAQNLARGLSGAMIGFLVCTVFLSNLYNSYLWLLAAFVAALRTATESVVAPWSNADSSALPKGDGHAAAGQSAARRRP